MLFRRNQPEGDPDRALREARETVKRVKSREREVKTIAAKARTFRERNHISEQVDEIIWGHLGG